MKYLVVTIISVIFTMSGFNASCKEAANKYAQRIVSLGPIITENIYLLEAQDRLVANTRYCVRPAGARDKEKVGSVMVANLEKIISLQPDLILATRFTRPEQVKKLKNLGFKVVQFKQSTSFEVSSEQFLQLGILLGLSDRAEKIIKRVESEVDMVKEKVSKLPKQKVFLQVGARPLKGSVPNSFTNDFIEFGGGVNVLAGQVSNKTNYETVIAKNPDLIIIAIMGSESGIAAQEKKHWQRFKVVNAVAGNRVHVIEPDLICSPSPATFSQTLKTIAGLIHPEISEEVEK